MSRRVKPVKMFCFYISTFLVSANKAVYKFYIDDDDDDDEIMGFNMCIRSIAVITSCHIILSGICYVTHWVPRKSIQLSPGFSATSIPLCSHFSTHFLSV